MHYTDIAEQIAELGLRKSVGATPAISVSTALNLSIKNDSNSPFLRLGGGMYSLKNTGPNNDAALEADASEQILIQSIGMFWERSNVFWKQNPDLFGQQTVGAEIVNFKEQIGIYLLYDRDRILYVGRSTKRPISQRLFEHTKDRLSGRWDRFSWFGIRGVGPRGGLLAPPKFEFSQESLATTLESLLIEAMEPALNRRRGDQIGDKEYFQVRDPEIENREKQEMLQALLNKANA